MDSYTQQRNGRRVAPLAFGEGGSSRGASPLDGEGAGRLAVTPRGFSRRDFARGLWSRVGGLGLAVGLSSWELVSRRACWAVFSELFHGRIAVNPLSEAPVTKGELPTSRRGRVNGTARKETETAPSCDALKKWTETSRDSLKCFYRAAWISPLS